MTLIEAGLKEVNTEIPNRKEILRVAKIVIVGPPHSGKSIAENFLRRLLPPQETMRIAAQPDGEGDWTQKLYGEDKGLVQKLRNKGSFTEENVDHWLSQVVNSTSRFSLIDVGGVVSPENRRICSEANAMIIVSSDPKKTQEWVRLANETGLNILAVLESTLDVSREETFKLTPGKDWESEGVVVGLDRGKFRDSQTLRHLASYLLERVPAQEHEEAISEFKRLTIDNIATMIYKEPEDIILPGKEPIRGLNWRPEELPSVYSSLKKMVGSGDSFVIDGRAPQFLVITILQALSENNIALADSKVEGGMVVISGQKHPKGEGSGPLPWLVTKDFQGGTLVEYSKDQFKLIDSKILNEVIPPDIDTTKPVFLSGKTSNWVSADVALTYARVSPAVYLYQPGSGFICVVSNNSDHKLGDVIKVNP